MGCFFGGINYFYGTMPYVISAVQIQILHTCMDIWIFFNLELLLLTFIWGEKKPVMFLKNKLNLPMTTCCCKIWAVTNQFTNFSPLASALLLRWFKFLEAFEVLWPILLELTSISSAVQMFRFSSHVNRKGAPSLCSHHKSDGCGSTSLPQSPASHSL